MVKDKAGDNLYQTSGKVDFQERCRNLNQTGQVLWFTGLSGAGKSTIAIELEKMLIDEGKAVYRLDGDNIRSGLNRDLGFTPEERDENIRRVAELAALFKDAGLITLVSFISPYQEKRDFARQRVGDDYFQEIYVKADIETCEKRDPKGLYEQARRGEIDNFTGISAPYEEPENPELVLDTEELSVLECAEKARDIIIEE